MMSYFKNTKFICVFSVTLAMALGLTACGGKRSGASIGAPKLKPPVVEATPNGLSSTLFALLNKQRDVAVFDGGCGAGAETLIKNDFFSGGPTDPAERLGFVDTRMNELDQRNQEFARACMSDSPKDWVLDLPGETTPITFKLSCVENHGSSLRVYFGFDSDNFYMIEVGQSNARIAVLAIAPRDGSSVKVWTYYIEEDTTGNPVQILNVYANRNTEELNLWAVASEDPEFLGGCSQGGSYLSSNGEFVYAYTNNNEGSAVCLNADDLSPADNATLCTSAALDESTVAQPTRVQADAAIAAAGTVTKIFNFDGAPSGLKDFND
jgi:hypothetical protein